jgi:hypothetical protein
MQALDDSEFSSLFLRCYPGFGYKSGIAVVGDCDKEKFV